MKHVLCSNGSWIDESSAEFKYKLDSWVISAYVGLRYKVKQRGNAWEYTELNNYKFNANIWIVYGLNTTHHVY